MNQVAVRVMLAALDVEVQDVAHRMGTTAGVLSNVICGFAPPGEAFKISFMDALREEIFGPDVRRFSTHPLKQKIHAMRQGKAPKPWCMDRGFSWQHLLGQHEIDIGRAENICDKLEIHPTEVWTDYA